MYKGQIEGYAHTHGNYLHYRSQCARMNHTYDTRMP